MTNKFSFRQYILSVTLDFMTGVDRTWSQERFFLFDLCTSPGIQDHCRYPANTIRLPNVGLMLAQRRRRWANSNPTLGKRIVFAGYLSSSSYLFYSVFTNNVIVIVNQCPAELTDWNLSHLKQFSDSIDKNWLLLWKRDTFKIGWFDKQAIFQILFLSSSGMLIGFKSSRFY